MAKGSMLMGTASGKLGEMVLYRRAGQQVQRARVREVKNPRTQKQMYQRMFFATIGKARSKMAKIIDHSFENVKHGQDSLNYFMSRNIELCRKNVTFDERLQAYVAKEYEFITPKWPYMNANPYRVSEGSFPSVLQPRALKALPVGYTGPFSVQTARHLIPMFGEPQPILDAAPAAEVLTRVDELIKAQGGVKGDYFTFVFTTRDASATPDYINPIPEFFHFVRFKVVAFTNSNDETDSKLGLVVSNVDGRQLHVYENDVVSYNPDRGLSFYNDGFPFAQVRSDDGNIQSLVINLEAFAGYKGEVLTVIPEQSTESITSSAWIHSRENSNTIMVSTENMLLTDTSGDVYDGNLSLYDAFDTWTGNAGAIGQSEYILEGGTK